MSLPAQHIAALRRAHIRAGLTTTVAVVVYQSGTGLAPATQVAEITEDQVQEVRDEDGRMQVVVRRISVRPMADPAQPVRIGDQVTYAGVPFVVIQVSGSTFQKWVCEYVLPVGIALKDRQRAVGK